MKATEFVKKFGIEHAKRIYANAYKGTTRCRADYEYFSEKNGEWFRFEDGFNLYAEKPCMRTTVDLAELKTIIDSHELIISWRLPEDWRDANHEDVLGLDGAAMYLAMFGGHELVGDELDRFEQAIEDVKASQ